MWLIIVLIFVRITLRYFLFWISSKYFYTYIILQVNFTYRRIQVKSLDFFWIYYYFLKFYFETVSVVDYSFNHRIIGITYFCFEYYQNIFIHILFYSKFHLQKNISKIFSFFRIYYCFLKFYFGTVNVVDYSFDHHTVRITYFLFWISSKYFYTYIILPINFTFTPFLRFKLCIFYIISLKFH